MAYEVTIRRATPHDAAACRAVYAPYVERTAVSFEWEAPSTETFRARMERTCALGHPYLVATRAGRVLGYACTGPFVGRSAYGWSAETTIYLAREERGQGLGSRLYRALEETSRLRGILDLNACIGYAPVEDEYLTNASLRFHERQGYRLVGTFHDSGHKFGRWYDMVWMGKPLGNHGARPASPRRCDELTAGEWQAAGVSL